MRIDAAADYFALASLEQTAADEAAGDAGRRASEANQKRATEHTGQIEAEQHAEAAAKEGGFWDSVCDLASVAVAVGAVVATGGAGVAGVAAMAGLAMTAGNQVATSTGALDRSSGLSLGLRIGGAVASAGGALGAGKGVAAYAGKAIAGAGSVTAGVGKAGASSAQAEASDARALALEHRAARERLSGDAHEAASDAGAALEWQGEASQRAQRFLNREHELALAVVRA